jgi:Siphovirus Gp157
MTVPALVTLSSPAESMFEVGKRLAALLGQAEQAAVDGRLPDAVRDRIADLVDALRLRVTRKTESDPRSLFDIDERLVELMDQIEEAIPDGAEIPQELLQEINDYFEAFRTKVDRIAGYWRWQESIADICDDEAERLLVRKKAAEGRLRRLKNMLLAFMMARGLKKLEGDKAAIGMQVNSSASLVVDDPSQVGECFFESSVRITKTELQEVIYQLADGELRRRLESVLVGSGWEINLSGLRCAILSNPSISGARLVRGHHVRLR